MEGRVRREVALEEALVVLEDVHAQPVQLHHEDGEHGDDDALALARGHLIRVRLRAGVRAGNKEGLIF